jgi:hypothetical protein
MIQDIISRMAGNSFLLKGWAVTLIAGIFALSSNDTDKLYFLVAYIPILVFWGLDSYYLCQERKYRKLYDYVRIKDNAQVDFSMNTSLSDIQDEKVTYLNCVFSVTELWFYFPLALLSAVIIIVTHI